MTDVDSIIHELQAIVNKIDDAITDNLHESSSSMQMLDFSESDLAQMRKKDKLLVASRRALEKAINELKLLSD